MSTKEKIKLISDLIKHYKGLNKCFDQIDSLIGGGTESTLFNLVWQTFDSYIKVVEQSVGDHGSVSWYIFENDCGKRAMICSFNKKEFKIKTVTDLVKFIELTS